MGLAGNLTGTTIAIVVLVIILLLGYSILQKLNQTQQQVSNVAALQQSFQSKLATVVSSTLSPAEFILETNQWLQLIMTLGVLFGTELGQKLRNMVEEAEKRQKARQEEKARAEDGDTRRAIDDQRPSREDLDEKVKKLQDESELKIRERADADGRAGDLDIKERQRVRIDPNDLDERIKKARETSEKVVRDKAHLDEIVRDNDVKTRANIRPTEDEIKDRVRKTQDASEKVVRSQAELDALTGDLENKKFLSKLETDADYIKKKVAEARDVSERKVRADAELDAALRDTRTGDLTSRLVVDADDVKSRVKKTQDGSERRVVANAEGDAVRTDTRTGDFTSRLVTDADDIGKRVKRLQDAAETKVRTDAEFDARVKQVGAADFTGRLVADSDALKARVAEARDASEHKVRADAELDAALKDTRAGDLTGRLVTDADDIGKRVKRLQDAAETKVRADAEFDARVKQVGVTDLTGRLVADSDALKARVAEARDTSERKVRADAELDAALKDTRATDLTNRLVADADDMKKRVKRLQDAAETKVRADAEFDARVKQVGATDLTGKLIVDADDVKSRVTKARDASERKVVADAELDAAMRDTNIDAIKSRLVADADDIGKRVKRLQDAAETKVRADAEFNARVKQVGATDLTGKLIVDADEVKSRVTKARDASERKVLADAELDAALKDTRAGDLTGRLVTDADDIGKRVKRLQDAAETKVRADAEFDARVKQTGAADLTGRLVADSDAIKARVAEARDVSERKVRADAELDAARVDTRVSDASRLVADADDLKSRVKRLQDAAETKIRTDEEFKTRVTQTGAADLTGRLAANADELDARVKKARDLSERLVTAQAERDAARVDVDVKATLPADADDLKRRVKFFQEKNENVLRIQQELDTEFQYRGQLDVDDLGSRFKKLMKNFERNLVNREELKTTIADIKARYRKRFARFPQTMDVAMTQIGEEAGHPRPRTTDGGEFVSTQELAEGYTPAPADGIAYTPEERASLDRINSHALEIEPRFMSAFGRAMSYPFRTTAKGARVLAAAYKNAIAKVKATPGYKMAAAVGDAMITNPVSKGLISTVDVIAGPGLDLLQLAMTFSDSGFAGIFPDASTLITAKTLKNIISKGVKIQLEALSTYNAGAKSANDDHTDPNYPYAYAQYPVIAGPLSALGMEGDAEHPRFKGDPLYNQYRIQTAVDAVREKILRDPNETFMGASFQSKMIATLTSDVYNTIINSSDDSLVGYIDHVFGEGEDGGKFMDELYFRAYSNVCSYYGGKVYEDNYAIGPASFTTWCPADGTKPGCSVTSNRRRFQCGFATEGACTMYANKWLGQDERGGQPIYGSYAEWFTKDDIDNFVLKDPTDGDKAMVDTTDPDNPSRPLVIQPAFLNGACIVTTSGTASLCRQGKGKYDPATHSCGFTPEFCQSIGTCYCTQDTGSCFLPNDTMEALSFFFGTGGPREWIKINGCRSSTCNPNSPIEYSQLATNGGEQWFSDMFANSRNWGPALKQSLGTPAGAMMFAGAVLGLAVAAGEFGIVTAASVAATASAAALAAGAAAETAASASAAILASSEVLGPAAILVAIGAGVAMYVEMGAAHFGELTAPTIDEAEYTVGGWSIITRPDGTKYMSPKRVSFTNGWVTYPIMYHPVNQLAKPYPNVDAFGFGSMRFFDTHFDWSAKACVNDHGPLMRACISANPGMNVGQRTCYQNWGNDNSPASPRVFQGPPKWIRAASDGTSDSIWCLPPFPVNDGTNGTLTTTGLFDPLIGTPAAITSTHLTNNTWTDGQDASYPFFPISSASKGGTSSDTRKWYYQLVYDEKSVCSSQYLWSTTYLQRYFSDITITNMRKKCCNYSLLDDLTGKTVDPKCWGYMSIKFQQWNFKPNTVIPTSATPIKAPIQNYTPVTTCAAGSYFERIQNRCVECPTEMYSPAGSYTCFSCGDNATLVGKTDCVCTTGSTNKVTVNGITSCTAPSIAAQTAMAAQSAGVARGSDVRLKKNMRKTGRFIKGFTEYTWEWNDEARRIGFSTHPITGIIAQEVLNVYPEVVIKGSHGYYSIDYTALFMIKDVVTAPAAVVVPGIVPDIVTVPGPMS